MSIRVGESLMSQLGELRHEPTAKRIRAVLGAATVIDSTRAALVWEPRRIVASYAVPEDDVSGELVPVPAIAPTDTDEVGVPMPAVSRRPVLDPSVPFGVHTADGAAVDLRADGQLRPGAGFRFTDPDLGGYVVLDLSAFDAWYEEDEPTVAHPRDPFHRIDVLSSSRHVRMERDGVVVAESSRPTLLFETGLPMRFYLPRHDVRIELTASPRRTYCAYKGQASYWSTTIDGQAVPDLAWTYESPLNEASQVRGLIAFFDERVDVVVDGQHQERPITPWS